LFCQIYAKYPFIADVEDGCGNASTTEIDNDDGNNTSNANNCHSFPLKMRNQSESTLKTIANDIVPLLREFNPQVSLNY
jgi:hypothetical protein